MHHLINQNTSRHFVTKPECLKTSEENPWIYIFINKYIESLFFGAVLGLPQNLEDRLRVPIHPCPCVHVASPLSRFPPIQSVTWVIVHLHCHVSVTQVQHLHRFHVWWCAFCGSGEVYFWHQVHVFFYIFHIILVLKISIEQESGFLIF